MRKLLNQILFALAVIFGSKLFIKSSVTGAFMCASRSHAQTFIWESRTTTKNTMLYKQLSPTSTYGNRWHVIYINADSMIWRHPRMYFDSLKLQSDAMVSSGKLFWLDNTTGAAKATRMDSIHLDWNKINGRPDVTTFATASNAMAFTNKTGNISQWTNDAGYLTSFSETDPLFNTKFAAKSTSDLAEGSNLYYTNSRSRGAVSAGIGLVYNSSTGQFIADTNAAVSGNSAIMYMGKANSAISNLNSSINGKQAQLNGTGFVKASGTTITYDNSTYLTSEVDGSTTNEIELPTQAGQSGKYLGTNGSAASWLSLPSAAGTNNAAAYASGSVYALTTTSQKIDFGTTDPVITIPAAGTYLILSNLKIEYSGLTTLATQTCSFKLRRTNNTAADISNASSSFNVPIVTLLTQTAGDADISAVIYTTSNSNDVIEMWGNRGASISAGAINVGEAWIVAIRIY